MNPSLLSERLGREALVRCDSDAIDELAIGIGGPSDKALAPIRERPSSEAVARAKHAAPPGADCVRAARDAVS